jgi:hypothetical protein
MTPAKDNAPATKADFDRLEALLTAHAADETPVFTEVSLRLQTVEQRQQEHIERNDADHGNTAKELRAMRKALHGNGEPGIAERLRTLERLAESIIGWGMWLKVGVGGLVLKALWDIITPTGQL